MAAPTLNDHPSSELTSATAGPASPGNAFQAEKMPYGLGIDTCRGSLLHFLTFAPRPGRPLTWPSRIVTYLVAALLIGGGILALVALAGQNFWTPAERTLEIPILRDYNALWTAFVTLPLLITLLRSERALIPERLVSACKSNLLIPHTNIATEVWVERFRLVNIIGQVAGLIVGVLVAWLNYRHVLKTASSFGNWIIPFAPVPHLHPAGWMYRIALIGLLWFLCTLYVARAAATVCLLWSIVRISEVTPHPFHPDRAGGLSQIGKIGLRNQYLLAAIGIQIVAAALVAQTMAQIAPATKQFQVAGILIGATVYAVLGPLVFISPLLPFRRSMQEKKLRALCSLGDALQQIVDSIVQRLPHSAPTADQEKDVARYKSLIKLIEREPVWPFDTVTLRRFFTAYTIPFLVWAATVSPLKAPVERTLSFFVPQPPAGPTNQVTPITDPAVRSPNTTNSPVLPPAAGPRTP